MLKSKCPTENLTVLVSSYSKVQRARGAGQIRPDHRLRICEMNPMLQLNGVNDVLYSPYNTFQQGEGCNLIGMFNLTWKGIFNI